MKFTHPDSKLQAITRYYLNLYGRESKNYKHSLYQLSKMSPDYFCIDNPFSFDDERYPDYPNHGWIEADYERILELNLEAPLDLREFRLIAANFARVLLSCPDKIKQMDTYPHFEAILEFVIIEGLYEYFSVPVEQLLLTCVRYKMIKAGDCGALRMSKGMIFKTWYEKLSGWEKIKFKCQQKFYLVFKKSFVQN